MTSNMLCHGDSLDMLRQHIVDETVDLVYLGASLSSLVGLPVAGSSLGFD